MDIDVTRSALLAKLRQLAPTRVRVYGPDEGDVREVAVPTRRKRWNQVIEAIEARPWVRVELLDRSGAALGYSENESAGEIEDISSPGIEMAQAGVAGHRWFLEMMLKAQQTVLSFASRDAAQVMQSMRDVLEVNTQATRGLIEIMTAQRDVAATTAAMNARAEAKAEAGSSEMEEILKLIEASPKLVPMIAPILQLMAGRSQPPARPPAPPVPPRPTAPPPPAPAPPPPAPAPAPPPAPATPPPAPRATSRSRRGRG